MPRICLIHAVRVAIDPVAEAFARLWPEAQLMNLLDDSLSIDRQRDGMLTPAMTARFLALGQYAKSVGVDGILFTCSAFGPAIEAVKHALAPMPVLKPNEAMFEAAMRHGTLIGMVATFEPAVASMADEFEEMAASGSGAKLVTTCVPEAMAALRSGDEDKHNQIVAEAAAGLSQCDAIMLAHFSTSRAAAAVARVTRQPVLTSPDCAVKKLRDLIESR